MLKKAKKTRRSAGGAQSQGAVRAVSDGSPTSSGINYPPLLLDIESERLHHVKSTPEDLHVANDDDDDDDDEGDAFL